MALVNKVISDWFQKYRASVWFASKFQGATSNFHSRFGNW